MSTKRLFGWVGAVTVLAAVVVCAEYVRPDKPSGNASLDFTLKDMNGRDVRLADFKGKPLIVNFWATWCGPCLLETPTLVELSARYKDRGVNIIGISYDDKPEEIREFAAAQKIPYPLLVGRDREDVFSAFGLGAGLPMTVFINPDGTI